VGNLSLGDAKLIGVNIIVVIYFGSSQIIQIAIKEGEL